MADDKARDVNDYSADEIRRILHFAFKSAQSRPRKLLTSVDKQNVLATSKLWRKMADEIADEYPDVRLEHQLIIIHFLSIKNNFPLGKIVFLILKTA